MRVLHVIPSLGAVHGGPSVALPAMERALCAEGIEVETATTDDEGPGLRNEKGDGQPRAENGVVRRYFRKQTEFYKVSLPLGRWLRHEVARFDVVHVHALFSHASVAAARAARHAGVPCIIRPLGVLNHYGVTRRRGMLKKLSLRWIEGPLLRCAAAVHFTSDAERAEAETLGIPFRAVVIPLGVEDRGIHEPAPDREPFVLFLSRLDPKKNVEGLLEAWARLQPDFPEWKLKVAGGGDLAYVSQLKGKAEVLGVGLRLEWTGLVEGKRKQRLLADAGVFVLPSFSENFGMAAAEALMAGKACLFSCGVAVGVQAAAEGAAEIAGTDSVSLAAGLDSLLRDPARREALGRSARLFAVNRLSVRAMAQGLCELYKSVTAGPR
jgi:glycosyltransferase involved in cell wall biosynthesis